VHIESVESTGLLGLFKCLLAWYHYLGFSGTVGENMKYMVFDREHNPLACLLFGSAAWKSAPRDDFIGWDADTRKANLNLLTNNMRFLILPWVRVPHLASYALDSQGSEHYYRPAMQYSEQPLGRFLGASGGGVKVYSEICRTPG
jgi:hypothetical protein